MNNNKQYPLHPCKLTTLSAALLLLATFPVQANETAPSKIEEVIVTAAKRDQSLRDFSGSISVINTDAPHLQLADIASSVPGFSIINAGPRNPTGLVIRGLRMDNVGDNDLGNDGGTVASYVDNIPLQGHFAPPSFNLKDLQQIEILRGPQGTLYGNASIGGLLRYITAKPDLAKNSASFTAAISQTDNSSGWNYDTDLIVNAPLIDNTLAVRLLLGKEHNDGFIDNPYLLTGATRDINSDDAEVARISVLWQATDALSFNASYHQQDVQADDRQASNPKFTGDNYTLAARSLQPMTGKLKLASLDTHYLLPWAALTASVNRYDYKTDTQADQTDYFLTLDEYYGEFYSLYDKFSGITSGAVDVQKDSAELRLVSPSEQSFRWLAGFFYSTDKLAVTVVDEVPGFSRFLELNRNDDIDYYASQHEDLTETSLYAEVAYDFTPNWEVLVGIRHFQYHDKMTICSGLPIIYALEDDELGLDCSSDKDKHNDLLGKFSTKYQLNEQHNIYFTIAEGFRRGGTNLLPIEITHHRSYQPDTAINYEFGNHSYFMQEQLSVSAALFYIDWKSIQVDSVVDDAYAARVNAKDARSQGIELEVLAKLPRGWSLTAGFSLTDAKLSDTVENINGGGENAYRGNRLPGSPRTQLNLALDYTQVLNSNLILDAGVQVSRMGDSYTALNDEFFDYDHLDTYTLANAQASVSWRNWRAGIFIYNMANTYAVTGKRSAYWYGEQGQFEYMVHPRTVGMSVNYHY